MKICYLQISNVLSFPYVENINDAERISFFESLNIIIGENGAGKSTALEALNLIFKRVIFKQGIFDYNAFSQRATRNAGQRKNILQIAQNATYNEYRLSPNWDTPDKPQNIRISIRLDDIDRSNIAALLSVKEKLSTVIVPFSNHAILDQQSMRDEYIIDVQLRASQNDFQVAMANGEYDLGFEYLANYNFYKEAINLYNLLHPSAEIANLQESFTLIGGYRNYHAFDPSVSIRDAHPANQINSLRSSDYGKSVNSADNGEPHIFKHVRLRVAEAHFSLSSQKLDLAEREKLANDLPFLNQINSRLEIVGLECRVKLLDFLQWQYSFEFFDKRRDRVLADINSLSAGQKAIIHLVFEAYGRGGLTGGLVIIDEPELHLHYQFQHEYLQVINRLNQDQKSQYILVTHSEALINSATISFVRRFSLDSKGHTVVKAPALTTDQKWLVKILDNTRATQAFFSKKILLVEGETDRYFFKAALQYLYPKFDQEICVLDIDGKGNFSHWTGLFEAFGLRVYRIGDFDNVYDFIFKNERRQSVKTEESVANFKNSHADCDQLIYGLYDEGTFILRNGDLESYLGIRKDLAEVILFCKEHLNAFLEDRSNSRSSEIRDIISKVAE